jgi:hypothetical protein
MDDFDVRLRARLERLANAVPRADDGQRAVTGVIVRPRARTSFGAGFALGGIVVLMIVAVATTGGPRLPAVTGEPVPTVSAPPGSPSASVLAPSQSAPKPARATMPPPGVALPYPDGCAAYELSPRRCDYIVAWAKEQAGLEDAAVLEVQLLGDPECAGRSRPCTEVRLGSQFVVRVRLEATDGVATEKSLFCSGIRRMDTLLCSDPPVIGRGSPTMTGGYWDTPCPGPAPANPCASAVPSPDPSALAEAVPLNVSRLLIPIDRAGTYDVPVGDAVLPNGILTEAVFDLADTSPAGFLVSPQGVFLSVESLDGGPPFENIHTHGWRTGTERVRASLQFSVEFVDQDAMLEVTDLSVR